MDLLPFFASRLPDTAKEIVGPAYWKYRSRSADSSHSPPTVSATRREDAPQHVLVVVVDALRPDFVPDVSVEFTHAISSAPWTFPSVTSVHTGLRPSEHRAVAHTHPDDERYAMPERTGAYPHFPMALESAGYETYAGLGFITPFLTLNGWYQTHELDPGSASRVFDNYRSWRGNRPRTAGYLHLSDLHAPVDPPDQYVARYDVDRSLPELGSIQRYKSDFDDDDPDCRYYREHKLRLHRAALEYVSDELERLVEEVRDDTLLIVTGDHGEALWEHHDLDRSMSDSRPNYCFGHGGTPFDVIARVPVAVSCPFGTVANPRGGWASLRDVPATVLESTVRDYECPGHSWHHEIPTDRTVICEGARYGVERKAVYRGRYKVIRSRTDDVTLTAEVTDAGERFVDLPEPVVDRLLEVLPDAWDDFDTFGDVSAYTKAQLEALGYR